MKKIHLDTIWNLAGGALPAALSIPAIAILAKNLSVAELGILTTIWAIIGTASILDLGISRATTRLVALSKPPSSEFPPSHGTILGTSVAIAVVLSALLSAAILFFSTNIISWVFSMDLTLQADIANSLIHLAIALPAVILTPVFQGHLEGIEEFRGLNIQKAITGILLTISPAIATAIDPTLASATLAICIARFATLLAAIYHSAQFTRPSLWRIEMPCAKIIVGYGGWVNVTNIISATMNYSDRILVSKLSGASASASYAIPSELVLRLSIIPNALSRAIFPSMVQHSSGAEQTKNDAIKLTLAVCTPIAIVGAALSHPVLEVWVGKEIADAGATPLSILLIGFLFSAVAQIPFTELQARGDSKIVAKIHACELPVYVAILIFMTDRFGPTGAAIAWLTRVTADCIIMLQLSKGKKP